jgi:hypothetical protein
MAYKDKQKLFEMMSKLNPDIKKSKKKGLIKEGVNELYKRPAPPSVELDVDFKADVGIGFEIPFTVTGKLNWTDQGIGGYEFWGAKGTDIHMAWEVNDFYLKEGSYDERYKQQINSWLDKNDDAVMDKLMDTADERQLYQQFDEPDLDYPEPKDLDEEAANVLQLQRFLGDLGYADMYYQYKNNPKQLERIFSKILKGRNLNAFLKLLNPNKPVEPQPKVQQKPVPAIESFVEALPPDFPKIIKQMSKYGENMIENIIQDQIEGLAGEKIGITDEEEARAFEDLIWKNQNEFVDLVNKRFGKGTI